MALVDPLVAAAGLVAAALAGARWLRVAQREGWAPFAATGWATRWWALPAAAPVAVVALASLVAVPVVRPAGIAVALAVAVGPPGLSLRGHRPGPLRWTPTARRVAVAAALAALVLTAAARLLGPGPMAVAAVTLAVLAPVVVDVAALATVGPDPADGVVPSGPSPEEVLGDLERALPTTRRVLVTSGPYGAAGRALAARAVGVATHLLIVGRHARADLQAGAAEGPSGCTVVLCADVDHAAAWIAAETEPVDTVRWLSVPPDHVP